VSEHRWCSSDVQRQCGAVLYTLLVHRARQQHSGEALQCTAAPCMEHGVCSRRGDMRCGKDAGTRRHWQHTARQDHSTVHVPPCQPAALPTCRRHDHEAADRSLHTPADPQRQLSAVHQLWPGHGTGSAVAPGHLQATSR
jgi:hypothetical protein